MLTTVDNPYDPKKDYVKWLRWDHEHGYNTQEYLARIANVSLDTEDDTLIEERIDQAIAEIIDNDSISVYKVV